jgi:hypothetical protein
VSTGRQSDTLQQFWPVPGTLSERYQIPSGLFGSAPSGGAAASGKAIIASNIKARIMRDRCNARASDLSRWSILLKGVANSLEAQVAAAVLHFLTTSHQVQP